MTILRPAAFNRSPAAGFDGVFDWDFLLPAFDFRRTRIQPMDLDAVVERFDWKLGFETKEGNAPIPVGQMITLESLAREGWYIVVLRAKRPGDIDGFDVWHGDRKWHYEGDADRLLKFCSRWFERASKHGHEPINWHAREALQSDLFQHQLTALETVRFLFHERLTREEQETFLAEVLGGPLRC